MTERLDDTSPQPKARITGIVYLLYFLTAVPSGFLVAGRVVSGDAVATANHLIAHQRSFRLGIAIGFIGIALYIAMAALFYDLFRPVNRTISLLAAFFNVVGCSVQAFSSIFQLAPLAVLAGSQYLGVFSQEQLQALAMLFLKLHSEADHISLIFFGIYCLLLGYLIYRSTFLPRILGVLMALAGVGWLTFLSPQFAAHLSPFIQIIGVVAEISLMGWLLVKGVNVQRWQEQARAQIL